jgi:hypothetical protein
MYKFNLKYFKLLKFLIWHFCDQPIFKAFLQSFFTQIAFLHTFFMQYKRKVDFEVKVNGQVRKLRWGLNQAFDLQLKRILVVDGTFFGDKYVFLHNENKPLYLTNYLGGSVYDFEVRVPFVLKYLEQDIINFVNQYRLPSKRFTIVYI